LKHITLSGCSKLTDRSIITLCENNQNINVINISHCYRLTKVSLSNLFQCAYLVSLDATKIHNIDSLTNVDFHNQTNLKNLYLRFLGIDDNSINIITNQFPKLTKLNLGCCNISDEGLYYISDRCTDLTELLLYGNKLITNEGIKYVVQKLNFLTYLDISSLETFMIGDEILIFISLNSKSIRFLNLNFNQLITDKGIEHISRLNLAQLEVYQCTQLTNETIFNIAKNCPNIKSFNCHGCPKITQPAINYLFSMCKYLNISSE